MICYHSDISLCITDSHLIPLSLTQSPPISLSFTHYHSVSLTKHHFLSHLNILTLEHIKVEKYIKVKDFIITSITDIPVYKNMGL